MNSRVTFDDPIYKNQYPKEERALYCTTCGSYLMQVARFVEYDIHTGERKYESWLRCPKRWWWHDVFSGTARHPERRLP